MFCKFSHIHACGTEQLYLFPINASFPIFRTNLICMNKSKTKQIEASFKSLGIHIPTEVGQWNGLWHMKYTAPAFSVRPMMLHSYSILPTTHKLLLWRSDDGKSHATWTYIIIWNTLHHQTMMAKSFKGYSKTLPICAYNNSQSRTLSSLKNRKQNHQKLEGRSQRDWWRRRKY